MSYKKTITLIIILCILIGIAILLNRPSKKIRNCTTNLQHVIRTETVFGFGFEMDPKDLISTVWVF